MPSGRWNYVRARSSAAARPRLTWFWRYHNTAFIVLTQSAAAQSHYNNTSESNVLNYWRENLKAALSSAAGRFSFRLHVSAIAHFLFDEIKKKAAKRESDSQTKRSVPSYNVQNYTLSKIVYIS
ncbi:hypothetical protein EVAR_99203_1 [Eumeta japonica]|uniref:Uncharacterized protein n=1 Tax=Eumeta variegata TaxID=151549 RepID=A0A4C1YPT6_EUMVA|nr:hypothetical protein EVAR_99203_1 [Eumeta japonica]